MNTLVWDNDRPVQEHYLDFNQENDDTIIDDAIVKVLEENAKRHPEGISWTTLMNELRLIKLGDYPSIMFRESLWRLMDMGQIELTPERLLKIA